MVYLSKIYTRTGDDGTTALGDGQRVAKTHPRIASYGTADELGAHLGIAATLSTDTAFVDRIQRIQNDLFDLGADLCVPATEDEESGSRLRVRPEQVQRLEREIDELNDELEPLQSFVLSGGTPVAAHLHLARCVARRCEREVLALAAREPVNEAVIHYLNRLSDFLFVLARHENRGGGEVLWKPGEGS